MDRWLAVVFLAGCTFAPRGLVPGGEDAAFVEPSDLSGEDLAGASMDLGPGGPDLMPPPALQVTHTTAGNTVFDLTAEGTLDWAHYGLNTASSVDHKSGAASLITASSSSARMQFSSYTPGFSWSNGTPTSSTTNTHTGSYVNGATHGFTVTLPASPEQHTAYLYLNTYNAAASFGAQLGDGSATSFAETLNASGNLDVRYALTWRAATATVLQITWSIITDNGSGSVDLLAITLQ